jgi:hypothetical protein
MKIYTQRLEDISPDQAFETVELTFDTRQKSRFRAALAVASILVRICRVLAFCVVVHILQRKRVMYYVLMPNLND